MGYKTEEINFMIISFCGVFIKVVKTFDNHEWIRAKIMPKHIHLLLSSAPTHKTTFTS